MSAVLDLDPSYAPCPSPGADMTLVAAHTAQQLSALFAWSSASAWGFRRSAARDAETVALKLITRAVETTGDPNPDLSLWELSKKELPQVGIRVIRRNRGLLIEVWDSDSTPPRRVDAHLAVVDDVSAAWSCYLPRGGGKVIWAELDIPQPRQAQPSEPYGSLPKRVAGASRPPKLQTPMRDLGKLSAVVEGLHRLEVPGGNAR